MTQLEWDTSIIAFESAGNKLFEKGEIDIEGLADIYESNIDSLLQYISKFDASKEKIVKQKKINSYLTELCRLREKQKELNKAIFSYNYKNMDAVSIWLQNKQFISEINDDKLIHIKSQIISQLFGSFKGLLQSIMKQQYGVLTTQQHIKLNKILTEEMTTTETDTINDNNNNNNNNKLSLIELPDDCLSYTMQFLDNYGRGTIRRCCKSLAVIIGKPLSVNYIEHDLDRIIGSNLYIPKIAKLIHCDKKIDNIFGIKLFNEHIDNFAGFNALKCYDDNILDELVNILNTNYKNIECQQCTADIMNIEEKKCPNLFIAMKYILNESDEWRSVILENISYWMFDVGFVYDAFKCKGLFDVILKYEVKDNNDDDDDDDDNIDDNNSLGKIINSIISKRYSCITRYMLNHGLLDKISYLIHHKNDYSEHVDSTLHSLLNQNIPKKYIGDIIKNKVMMEYLMEDQEYDISQQTMNNIIKYANYDERINIIKNYDVTDDIKATINSFNDTIVLYEDEFDDDDTPQIFNNDNEEDSESNCNDNEDVVSPAQSEENDDGQDVEDINIAVENEDDVMFIKCNQYYDMKADETEQKLYGVYHDDNNITESFFKGTREIAALSASLKYPNIINVPFDLINAYKHTLALTLELDTYSWHNLDIIKQKVMTKNKTKEDSSSNDDDDSSDDDDYPLLYLGDDDEASSGDSSDDEEEEQEEEEEDKSSVQRVSDDSSDDEDEENEKNDIIKKVEAVKRIETETTTTTKKKWEWILEIEDSSSSDDDDDDDDEDKDDDDNNNRKKKKKVTASNVERKDNDLSSEDSLSNEGDDDKKAVSVEKVDNDDSSDEEEEDDDPYNNYTEAPQQEETTIIAVDSVCDDDKNDSLDLEQESNDNDDDHFIFHLPAGLVDFNESFYPITTNGDQDINKMNIVNDNNNNNKLDIIRNIWSNYHDGGLDEIQTNFIDNNSYFNKLSVMRQNEALKYMPFDRNNNNINNNNEFVDDFYRV